MTIHEQLLQRSGSRCELCPSTENLQVYEVKPSVEDATDNAILICNTCLSQIERPEPPDANHWRCLNTSMWSEVPAIQVVAWRMLKRLSAHDWASDNLDMLYLDDAVLSRAKAGVEDDLPTAAEDIHKDSNGQPLQNGDSVVLTKTLDVKGSSLSAKLGTVVKNIKLVEDNTDQIEGRVEGQLIVILTKYVRRQS